MTRAPDRETRRLELLDAADRIVQRDGPAASMSAIAAEAGITKPILYRQFGDKSGLYAALAERHIDRVLAGLRASLVTPRGRRARTTATIATYLAFIEDQPQVYRFLMHRASVEEPEVHSQVAVFLRRFGDELGRGIAYELAHAAGRREATVEESLRAVTWGHAIVGMVQASGDWWLEHRAMSREALAEQLTDLLWGAFATAD